MYRNELVIIICLLLSTFSMNLSAQELEKLYYRQCATCHGDRGDGQGRAGAALSPAPTDFTALSGSNDPGVEKMEQAIRNGITGTSMVGYGVRFDDSTISQLVSYIRTRFMGIHNNETDESDPGRAIYINNCAVCHGDNGNSGVWARNSLNPPPRDFTTEKAKEVLSKERMIVSVTYGRPGTGMMPFSSRLSTKQIEQVVHFIRTNFMHIKAENNAPVLSEISPAPDVALYPGNLRGDPEKGKLFFQSNCYVCHGRDGRGDGPRADFNIPRPRNFTTKLSHIELTRARLFHSISNGRRGSVMPAWKTVLTPQQIANVAEYVYETFVNPQKKKD